MHRYRNADNIQADLLKISALDISEIKKANISAIFQKGSKLDPGSYCPISVFPVISKLLERIVGLQNYLIYTKQLTQ